MRKILVANWKMNLVWSEAEVLLDHYLQMRVGALMFVAALPFPYLALAHRRIAQQANFRLAAQNLHAQDRGAYTGEVSARMLRDVGAEFVLVGHSERRQYFGEQDALLLEKVKAALRHGLRPIFCVGEPLSERTQNTHYAYVQQQLMPLRSLDTEALAQVLVAYEPIWAIGTGQAASAQEAADMCAHIQSIVTEGKTPSVPVLYGGSVNPDNAAALFAQLAIHGALVGSASLDAEALARIANALVQS